MILGAHIIVFSRDADADIAFFRDVLGFSHVDAGNGRLIFALPPAEAAVHPTDGKASHELYLQSDHLEAEMARLRAQGIAFTEVHEANWGSVTHVKLPGSGQVGLYQPKHPLAHPPPRS